jgi:hypothetical protein
LCNLYYIPVTWIALANMKYQLVISRDLFISSEFDMYCNGCTNIPFWRWIKRNQQCSISITCSDYDGEKLSNLQASNFTDCNSEYLSSFGFESALKFIACTLKYRHVFYEGKIDHTKGVIKSCNRRRDNTMTITRQATIYKT